MLLFFIHSLIHIRLIRISLPPPKDDQIDCFDLFFIHAHRSVRIDDNLFNKNNIIIKLFSF